MPAASGMPRDVEHVRHLVVDGVHQVHPVAETRQAARGDRKRVVVAIEADELQLRQACEEGLGVPGHAESRVDEHRAGRLQRRG